MGRPESARISVVVPQLPPTTESPPLFSLTANDRRIIDVLVQRAPSTDEIARRLGLTPKTVTKRMTIMFEALGLDHRGQLIVQTYQRRWAVLVDRQNENSTSHQLNEMGVPFIFVRRGRILPPDFPPREHEVFSLIVTGASTNKEIGDRLVVTEKSAENYVNLVLARTRFGSKAALIAHAFRNEWVRVLE